MERHGHAGLTFGLVGLGSAIWVRRRLSDRLDYLTHATAAEIPPVKKRIARRSPLALAAVTVTGAAVVTSGYLDSAERKLFGPAGHRKKAHSVFHSTKLYKSIKEGADNVADLARLLCAKLGIDDETRVQQTIRATKSLVKFVSKGAYLGQLTHVLGDIPTCGKAGVTALQALTPLSDRNLSLGLVKSGSGLWNKWLWQAGLVLGTGSILAICVYASTPQWPKSVIRDAVRTVWHSPSSSSFYNAHSVLTKFSERVGTACAETDPDRF